MRELSGQLQTWRAQGLLTPEQAAAIAAYEAVHGEPRAPRRTLLAEALGYVGAALAVGAVGMIVSEIWHELTTGPRLTLVGLVVVLLGGAALALHRAERAPLQRLATVLFTGAIVGIGWFAAIVATDLAAMTEGRVGLAVGGAVLVAAVPLHLRRPRALHQLTVLVAALVVAVSALSLTPMPVEAVWYGLTISALGAAWFALAVGGWLHPRVLAEVSGSILAVLALQATGDEQLWPLFLALVLAGALIALAIVADRLHHLVVGASGLFVLVPQLVIRLFGDSLGAPAVMLIIGLLLVLLAVGVGRARREVGGVEHGPTAPADAGPTQPPPLDPTTTVEQEEVPR
jgi:hypothetical protein